MQRRVSVGLALIAFGSIAFSACGGGDGDDEAGAAGPTESEGAGNGNEATSVSIIDNLFTPAQRRVQVGDEGTWTWKGQTLHSVTGTFAGEPIDSGQKSSAETFSHKFESAGVFEYHCTVHATMKATVTVE